MSEPFLWIPPLRFIIEYYESIHHCTVQNKMENVFPCLLAITANRILHSELAMPVHTVHIFIVFIGSMRLGQIEYVAAMLSGDGNLQTRITKSAQESHWFFVLPNWSFCLVRLSPLCNLSFPLRSSGNPRLFILTALTEKRGFWWSISANLLQT